MPSEGGGRGEDVRAGHGTGRERRGHRPCPLLPPVRARAIPGVGDPPGAVLPPGRQGRDRRRRPLAPGGLCAPPGPLAPFRAPPGPRGCPQDDRHGPGHPGRPAERRADRRRGAGRAGDARLRLGPGRPGDAQDQPPHRRQRPPGQALRRRPGEQPVSLRPEAGPRLREADRARAPAAATTSASGGRRNSGAAGCPCGSGP